MSGIRCEIPPNDTFEQERSNGVMPLFRGVRSGVRSKNDYLGIVSRLDACRTVVCSITS
jgi:hypothetical protein